ncbi:MAG: ExbD/TolR family protein [Deltaproteobacteria bacterium]|nr:ExbD/TolR family protein [Deltaproteobacteria bacterium]
MLVLLVIFMVTAPMMESGIDVNLPRVEAGQVTAPEEPLVVTIDREGKIFINTRQLAPSELGVKLRAIFERRADRVVYLKADEDVPYGTVARVMSEVRRSGVERIAMITETPREKR